MSLFSRVRGIHPRDNKTTIKQSVVPLTDFAVVRIPMNMQIGPGCKPCVTKGEIVLKGQIIGEPVAPMAVPIHASVAGTVTAVKREIRSDGSVMEVIEIKPDGTDRLDLAIKPPVVTDAASLVEAARASGLVGLGGAGFPTHIKLNPPKNKKLDLLIINAVECEPWLTVDDRLCQDHADEILDGVALIVKHLQIPQVIIGMEKNMPDGIASLKNALKRRRDETELRLVDIELLTTRYPQGAEKVLIRSVSGRIVPEGGLPSDVGALVMNVGTIRSLGNYVKDGVPLISRMVTLAGSALNRSGNYEVPIGALISEVIEKAGGFKTEPQKVIMGGPMMGVSVDNLDVGILKNNNAVLAFSAEDAKIPSESACIRCGRCVRTCPMQLLPAGLDVAARRKNVDALRGLHVMNCIECGCCTYICPAKRYLVQNIRIGKLYWRNAMIADQKKAEEAKLLANKEVK